MKQALRDLAALVARVGVGGLFFANGWTKLERGLINTGADFKAQGAPAPGAWATVTMLTELIGGALLIAGLAVSVTGLVLFLEALAVFLIAPPLNPITTNELIALGAAAILLAVVGAGRISVDHMVVIRRRESEAASEFAADNEADEVIASLRDPDELRAEPASGGGAEGDAAGDGPSGRGAAGSGTAGGGSSGRGASGSGASGGGASGGGASEAGASEDTAPHPRPRRRGERADEPGTAAPGDTLVAGRKKPPARGRKTADGE